MPRYFFDVHDDEDIRDDSGTEMPNPKAVRGEAIRFAGEMLKDIDGKEWSMTVRDETGRVVLSLRFSATEH